MSDGRLPTVAVYLLGPLGLGISGGDVHAVRLVDRWHRRSPGTATLLAPAPIAAHVPTGAAGTMLRIRTPLDALRLRLPIYVVNVSLRALLATLRGPQADVVIAGSHFFHDVLPCVARARLDRSRVAVYAHHLIAEERHSTGLRSRISILLERFSLWVLRDADPLIFVDNLTTARALEARGFDSSRIEVTQNASDPVEPLPPRAPAPDPLVAFVGRLSVEKGVWDALEVAARIPKARFELIGDGPMREEALSRVARLGLTNVTLRGFVPEDEKWRVLRAAHVFIAPSREEGWGIAVGEALTAGLPVIAFDLPAYQHYGEAVHRVPIGDVDLFAEAVRTALSRADFGSHLVDLPLWDDVLDREIAAICGS